MCFTCTFSSTCRPGLGHSHKCTLDTCHLHTGFCRVRLFLYNGPLLCIYFIYFVSYVLLGTMHICIPCPAREQRLERRTVTWLVSLRLQFAFRILLELIWLMHGSVFCAFLHFFHQRRKFSNRDHTNPYTAIVRWPSLTVESFYLCQRFLMYMRRTIFLTFWRYAQILNRSAHSLQ